MLIEFSVSNFRSFRKKQTFSMVAAPRLRKKGNVFTPNIKGEKIPSLLKIAAIYGPNASGKSNLLKAFDVVRILLKRESSELSKRLPVSPFRFDPLLINQPSRFEIHFIAGGQRYEFALALTPERIMEERLISFPKGKETLLYKRLSEVSGERYILGDKLEGGPILHDVWKKLTNEKNLFIAQVIANSSEELQQLKAPYIWLRKNFGTLSSSLNLNDQAQIALSIGHDYPRIGEHVSSLLHEIDIPVTKIKFLDEGKNENNSDIPTSLLASTSSDKNSAERMKRMGATLTHKTELGTADFDFKEEESEGTKNLVALSIHLYLLESKGSPRNFLIIDEFDSSLHPNIVAKIIEKLLEIEEKPIQLIFTTHDTHIMDTKLLRRDQIWLTERDKNGATQLRSIQDFSGRESEDVEKRYYEGRYRGLPILR